MAGLNWKSDAPTAVTRPLPEGNGIIRPNGTSGVILCDARICNGPGAFFDARALGGYIGAMSQLASRSPKALLALEDGRIFEGESFGATGTSVGEVCFNTSMTGYQEVLTDPSYRGQIVAMTYPLIGNYGTNATDQESSQPHVRGFVIEELSEAPSNWRAEESLDDYLRRWEIPGLQGVDTRALTRHLRTRGAMKACLTTEITSHEEAVRRAVDGEGVVGMDYVREVTTPNVFRWDPDDQLSRQWTLQTGDQAPQLPPIRHRIVAFDYGMKRNILRSLR